MKRWERMGADALDAASAVWTAASPWPAIALGALILLMISWLIVFFFQERLLYFPDPRRISPEAAGVPGCEEDEIDTPDGERLVLWRAAPQHPDGPYVLYLLGNRRGLWRRARFFRMFLEHFRLVLTRLGIPFRWEA